MPGETLSNGSNPAPSPNCWAALIDDAYSRRERPKVDQSRAEYSYWGAENYPEITRSRVRKIGRMVLDLPMFSALLPRLSMSSQRQRTQEAMRTAYDEEKAESEALEEQRRTAEEQHERERQERETRRQTEQAERERLALERDMAEAMDRYRYNRNVRYETNIIQELSERAFNEKLTKLEDVALAAEAGGSEVSQRKVDFDGKELTVYDLKGLPFTFLQHNICFKGTGGTGDANRLGAATAKHLQDHPEFWAEKQQEESRYGGNSSAAISNTISSSYINLDELTNGSLDMEGEFYGFDHVLPDSILQIINNDGGTANTLNTAFLKKRHPYLPEHLERPNHELMPFSPYNEVQTRRYDGSGSPRLPDYMIAKDNRLSDVTLRHAAYFDIPIINIDTKVYKEKYADKLGSLMETVNESTDYPGIHRVFNAVNSAPVYGNKFCHDILGLRSEETDIEGSRLITAENTARLHRFLRLESSKRIEYIKSRLEQETQKIQQATQAGERYDRYQSDIRKALHLHNGDNCALVADNRLDFEFKLGDDDMMSATVFDGDHLVDTAPIYAGANSQIYNELVTATDSYQKALEANRNL